MRSSTTSCWPSPCDVGAGSRCGGQSARLWTKPGRVSLRARRPTWDPSDLARRTLNRLERDRRSLRRVINATGILLHTGLGRAPLASEAIEAVAEVARGYSNLEFDLDEGTRGKRTSGVAELLRELTGAAAGTVVNNNAGATVIALRALAAGREVIVSRGQLVEIGGSFRLPEIFEVSGARLREVGTTNKTRLSDYRNAIGPDTAAIMRVHPSNFRIVGFSEQPEFAELVDLAQAHGLWAIDDIGSGVLAAGVPPGVADDEPTASGGIADGADLVLFSGDKLLGGPQCGILVGGREAIGRIEVDPLMRALRVNKMTLAALEATLRLALDADIAVRRIPLWALISEPLGSLETRGLAGGGTQHRTGFEGRGHLLRSLHWRRQRPHPSDRFGGGRHRAAVPGRGAGCIGGCVRRGAAAVRPAGRGSGP